METNRPERMMPLSKPVSRLFAAGSLVGLGCMVMIVVIQIISRFLLETTPHWTEEAARIFFIYTVAFGTGTGFVNGDFISLDLIGRHLSPSSDRVLQIFINSVLAGFSIILIIYSISFVSLGMDEKTPALRITTGFVFISMVITGAAVLFFTLANLLTCIKRSTPEI